MLNFVPTVVKTAVMQFVVPYAKNRGWCQVCHTASHRKTLTLQQTVNATPCNILQHPATHCNTLQHTATYCNTLQHTTTYCNILLFSSREGPAPPLLEGPVTPKMFRGSIDTTGKSSWRGQSDTAGLLPRFRQSYQGWPSRTAILICARRPPIGIHTVKTSTPQHLYQRHPPVSREQRLLCTLDQ